MKALELFFRSAGGASSRTGSPASPSPSPSHRQRPVSSSSASSSSAKRPTSSSPSRLLAPPSPQSSNATKPSSTNVANAAAAAAAAAAASVTVDSKVDVGDESGGGALPDGAMTARVRGSLRVAVCPTGFEPGSASSDLPHQRLQLDWVYGYRGNDCRSNIHTLRTQEIVYFSGHLVIILNLEENQQRHYREHTAEVQCISVHSDGVTVASGQGQGQRKPSERPCIRVWRSDTMETLGVLGDGQFHGSVVGLAFCKPSFQLPVESDISIDSLRDRLLSISEPPDHVIALWDAKRRSLIASSPLGTDIMCDCEINPQDPNLFVTVGKDHTVWWEYSEALGAINIKAAGEYQTFFKARYVVSLLHNRQGDLITGDSNGNVYVWGAGGNLITNYIKHAHEGPVFSLCLYRGWLLTGGRDGAIRCWQWGRNMDRVSELRLPITEGAPRCIRTHRGAEADRLIVGTTANSMLDCPLCPESGLAPLEGVAFGDVPITQGHYDQLLSLSLVPGQGCLFITAGYDSQVCIFNADNHCSVQKTVLKKKCITCASWDESSTIIFGTRSGEIIILYEENSNLVEVFKSSIAHCRVSAISMSHTKETVAVGGSDGRVHFLQFLPTEEDPEARAWQPAGQVLATRHGVDALDFAADFVDEILLVCATNTSGERVVCDAKNFCLIIEEEKFRDISWKTYNFLFAYYNVGAWNSKSSQESSITSVDVCLEKELLAVGLSNGHILLYKYPCTKSDAYCHTFVGPTKVTGLRFTPDGRHLISIGGQDACVMQWRLT